MTQRLREREREGKKVKEKQAKEINEIERERREGEGGSVREVGSAQKNVWCVRVVDEISVAHFVLMLVGKA